jgi:hypothetical protein
LTRRQEVGTNTKERSPTQRSTEPRIIDAISSLAGLSLHRHYYVKIPPVFWTNGWIAVLSGRAVAMLLTLLAERADKPETAEVWLSPGEAALRVGLSEESRSKGSGTRGSWVGERRRRPVGRDVFDFRRLRNVYVLDLKRLDKHPDE